MAPVERGTPPQEAPPVMYTYTYIPGQPIAPAIVTTARSSSLARIPGFNVGPVEIGAGRRLSVSQSDGIRRDALRGSLSRIGRESPSSRRRGAARSIAHRLQRLGNEVTRYQEAQDDDGRQSAGRFFERHASYLERHLPAGNTPELGAYREDIQRAITEMRNLINFQVPDTQAPAEDEAN